MVKPVTLSETLNKIQDHAPTLYMLNSLLEIEKTIRPILPEPIREYIHVCGYLNLRTLILSVPSGVHATKLRVIKSELIHAINRCLAKESIVIEDIKIILLPQEKYNTPQRPLKQAYLEPPQPLYQPTPLIVQSLLYLIKHHTNPKIQKDLKRILRQHLYNLPPRKQPK